jgi:chromosome segregation ATPase
MTNEELTKEFFALKKRLEIAETKLSQQAGAFEFITGQLRDVQLYMHARFDDMDLRFNRIDENIAGMKSDIRKLDAKFDSLEAKFVGLEAKVDALPRIIAELMTKR